MIQKLAPIKQPTIKITPNETKKNKILLEPIKSPGPQPTTIARTSTLNRNQPKNEMIKIGIKQLPETIESLVVPPTSTPLIIDPTQRVDVFYTYSNGGAIFIEAKKYVIETLITKKMAQSDALEEMRKCLVLAMKQGKPLVIRMTDSAADFELSFVRDDCFPPEIFQNAGSKFFKKEYYSKVVRQEDMENGVWVTKEGFHVVVTTMFDHRMYQMYLQKCLPLKHMTPILIEPPSNGPVYSP
jgi:hypothetical protein